MFATGMSSNGSRNLLARKYIGFVIILNISLTSYFYNLNKQDVSHLPIYWEFTV